MNKQFLVMALTDIIPYENNPRINDEAVADVVESIRQCENLDPIEVDENNVILSGHTRLKALQELGFEKTEVMKYTGLTEEQKKKYRLLANKTGEKALWDFSKLEKELEGLNFDDFDFGFGAADDALDDIEVQDFGEDLGAERKGSMADKYLVPPFSVIYANKPDWLARKRAWVAVGLHSEIGRGGNLRTIQGARTRQETYRKPGGEREAKHSRTTQD